MVEIVGALMSLIVLAAVVEFVTDVIKRMLPFDSIGKVPVPPIISLIVGVAVAILVKADMFSYLDYTVSDEYVAFIITGIVLSAGSKAVHELVRKLRESRGQRYVND